MSKTFILGMNAKLYQGAVPGDPPDASQIQLSALAEMANVRDLNLTMEAGEADVTTRANQGWRGTAPTLREATLEFEMVWRTGDVGFEAIKTAYLTSTTIALAPLTDDRATAGAEGPVGEWSITNFSRSEPLEEAIIVSVTAKLAGFTEWHKT